MDQRFLPTSPVKGTTLPGNVIYIDVQSKPIQLKGAKSSPARVWHCAAIVRPGSIGSARKKTKTIVCEDAATFWEVIQRYQRERQPLWVFGYDLRTALRLAGFWTLLESGEYCITGTEPQSKAATMQGLKPFRGIVVDSPETWFVVCRGTVGTVKFVDVGNYTSKTPAELADCFRRLERCDAKGSEILDPVMNLAVNRANLCMELVDRLQGIWQVADGGVWKPTVAAMSMSSYQRSKEHGLPIVDTAGVTKDLERDCYYAGRILVGFQGQYHGKVYKVDSRSFYGYMMSRHLYPCRLVKRYDSMHPLMLNHYLAKYQGAAFVKLESPKDEYPVRTLSGTAYCRGSFWTSLCGPELERASREGHITAVEELALYETADLFSEWANRWWELRLLLEGQGKRVEAAFVKRILVSLSGKWAQQLPTWEPCPGVAAPEPWHGFYELHDQTGTITEYRSIGWSTFVRTGERHKARSFPAISAFIAAYGREYMRTLFASLPPKSMLYSAVDSLVVTEAGLESINRSGLIDPNRLGGFAVEETADRLIVFGPQHYQIGDRVVLSGVHKDSFPVDALNYAASRKEPGVMQRPARPDERVRDTLSTMAIPHRPTLEAIGPDGWTQPIALALGASVRPQIDVGGLRRVPISLLQVNVSLR